MKLGGQSRLPISEIAKLEVTYQYQLYEKGGDPAAISGYPATLVRGATLNQE